MTICAIVGIVGLSLLPVEHMHPSRSQGWLVHRHLVEHATDHHEGFSHPDHELTTTLTSAFISVRPYALLRPLVDGTHLIAAPDSRVVTRLDRGVDPLPHGPPVRLDSLPAPPA